MSSENGPGRQNQQDGRGSQSNFSLLLYLGLAAVLALLCIVGLSMLNNHTITHQDLMRLIAASARDADGNLKKGSTGYIDAKDESGKTTKTVRVSNLRKVSIAARAIKGTFNLVELKPSTKDPELLVPEQKTFQPGVSFSTTYRTDGDLRDKVESALEAANVDFIYTEPTPWENYGPFILFFLLVSAVIYFMMRRLGGAGSPMAFGRSRGRLYAQEDLGVTFHDVAGIDEAVD
jgi:cell division protease FtsH